VLGQPPRCVVAGVEADGGLALAHPRDLLSADGPLHRGDFTPALRIATRKRGHRNAMKKLLIPLLAALAIPAAASAHDVHHALYARLSGTGTIASANGTMTSMRLHTGTFHSTVTTTGAATTRTGDRGTLTCASATAALTLVGTTTVTATLTGRMCTWTRTGSTTAAGSMFWGRNAMTATKAFLVARAGAVHGVVFAGADRMLFPH
jgi:hypothetical protein